MREPILDVLLSGYGARMCAARPVFEDLLPHACRLRTVLGDRDAALASILTGRLPADHGVWRPFEVRRPLPALRPRPRAGPPRSLEELLGRTRPGGARTWRCDPRLPDDENVTALMDVLRSGELDRGFLRLGALREVIESHGTGHEAVGTTLSRVRDQVGTLLDVGRRVAGAVELRLFSDQGLVDRSSSLDVTRVLRRSGLREGREYLVSVDGTAARFRFLLLGAEEIVRQVLEDLRAGRFLDEKSLKELGLLFPDRRQGDAFFLMDEGGFVHADDHRQKPRALSGYHPSLPSMDAVALFPSPPPSEPGSLLDLRATLFETRVRTGQDTGESRTVPVTA